MDVALLVGGAVITETVFNLQGLGYLRVSGDLDQRPARRRSASSSLGAVAVAVMNLVVDIAYAFLDPRVRYREHGDAAARRPRPHGPLPDPRRRRPGRRRPLVHASSAARRSAIVGESGSGKSVTNLAIMGLNREPREDHAARSLFKGRDLLALPPSELPRLRGKDIAMIFQDPFACLHPMYRVGDQIAEAVTAHATSRTTRRARRAVETARRGRHPERAAIAPRTTRTSSRAACASAR